MPRLIIIIVGLGFLLGFLMQRSSLSFFTMQSSQAFAQAPAARSQITPVKVITRPIEITKNDKIFRAVGTGRAKMSASIYPAVAEEVVEVLFKAQDFVKKGDILVRLDDRQEQVGLRLAEVQLKDAKRLLTRYEQAGKEGAVPESEVDNVRADYEAAKLAVERAKIDLDDRRIKAPFDGYVGISNIDPGDRVTSSTLITGLDARDVLFVDFEVPEALIGDLKKAQDSQHDIIAQTPSYLSLSFLSNISALDSRVNAERRTMVVRVSIDNSDDLLRPGMSFETLWKIPGKNYPTVPEIAVQWGRDGSYVWLVRDGKSVKVPAKIIARKAGLVLLDGEITRKDQVVVEGLQRLRANQPVDVLGGSAHHEANG